MKRSHTLLFLLFLMLLGGCNKEKTSIEVLNAGQERFCYEGTEETERIAVDENGQLYTVTTIWADNRMHSGNASLPPMQQFCVYDLEGNCMNMIEVEAGNSTVFDMLIQEENLYFTCAEWLNGKSVVALFRMDITTWEVIKVAELEEFYYVQDMVLLGDYMYFLGKSDLATTKKDMSDASLPWNISYNGEQIGRVNINAENSKTELMSMEFPRGMFGTEQETLVMYCYDPDNGLCFFEFNPRQDTLIRLEWESGESDIRQLAACGNGFLFIKETHLFYGTLNDVEAELLPDEMAMVCKPVYRKGFVFFKNDGMVERIYIADIMQDTRIIRLLMHTDTPDKSFGCGYQMEKTVLDSEKFALKVLAQDADFDVCLLSSRHNCSYNLKKNGAFYSLNEVEGVQEYLDACFPYVKEMAINEEGEIWMIPVSLAIPGMVYNKEFCTENNVNLEEMDFLELLTFTQEIEREQSEKTSLSMYCAIEELFGQYLQIYESFDTELFRSYAEKLQEIYKEQGAWKFEFEVSKELNEGRIPEVYYEYCIYSMSLSAYAEALNDSDIMGIIGVPGIAESVGNVGTLTFLAVNPKSENLEATLDYITAYVEYMMQQKDSFILADRSGYQNTPFYKEWYELYADGVINFAMDQEVYLDVFNDYLLGKLELEQTIEELERRRKLYIEE